VSLDPCERREDEARDDAAQDEEDDEETAGVMTRSGREKEEGREVEDN